mgnify:CR=1 FL=1
MSFSIIISGIAVLIIISIILYRKRIVHKNDKISMTNIDFNYTVTDNNGGFDTATVSITVISSNDPPVAVDDSVIVSEDSVDNQIDVLANDYDIDGDNITEIVVVNSDTSVKIWKVNNDLSLSNLYFNNRVGSVLFPFINNNRAIFQLYDGKQFVQDIDN